MKDTSVGSSDLVGNVLGQLVATELIHWLILAVLSILISIFWRRICPQSVKNKVFLFYERLKGNDPYLNEIKMTDAMEEIIEYSKSRVFIIRIGDLYINDTSYKERMKYVVEIDHIWDWHIFTKKSNGSQSEKWLDDFYNRTEDDYSADEDNSTTNLLCIDRSQFVTNEVVSSLFKQYGIDNNFDDIIIHGILKNVHKYPILRKALTSHLNDFHFQGVTIISNDGEKNYSIKLMHKEFSIKLLKEIINIDSYKYQLFVDQEFTKQQIQEAHKLVRHITS
jgi:hypothetical protein